MSVVWTWAIGLVLGLLARMVLPGARRLGVVFAAVIGVTGAVGATVLADVTHWVAADAPEAPVVAAGGCLALLAIVGLFKRISG